MIHTCQLSISLRLIVHHQAYQYMPNYRKAFSPFVTSSYPSNPLTIQFMSETHYLHSAIFYFNTALTQTRWEPGSKLTESLTVFIFIITFELFGLSYFICWICNIIMWHRENLQHVIRSLYFAKELKTKRVRRVIVCCTDKMEQDLVAFFIRWIGWHLLV